MTPAERLRAMADEAENEAVELLKQEGKCAEAVRGLLFAIKMLKAAAEVEREGLPVAPKSRKLGTMDAQVRNRGASVSAARTKNPLPFQAALATVNSSPPQWAAANKLEPEVVKSWLKKPGKGGRRIPREWALRIAREFVNERTGQSIVPADESSWPNGIRD